MNKSVDLSAVIGWLQGDLLLCGLVDAAPPQSIMMPLNTSKGLRGLSPRQAALSTWTGRVAIRHGYTDVYVPKIRAGVIRPVFAQTSQVMP